MKSLIASLFVSAMLCCSVASAEAECPRTSGSNTLGSPLPASGNWYGSEALAVQLPPDGIWPTTAPAALIAVKLFWWSAGFKPGMESNLNVTLRELSGAPVTAVVSEATNAYADSLGGWTMLTGIDFPNAGCWEVTGSYQGRR